MKKSNLNLVLVAAVLAVMVTGNVARADLVVTTADGSGADTYIRGGTATSYKDNNYGGRADLSIKHNTGDPDANDVRKAYVKFDISTWADSVTVSSATFKLTWEDLAYNDAVSATLAVYALDSDVGDSWGETAIRWDNAPGNEAAGGGVVAADTTYLDSISWTSLPSGGDEFSITITDSAKLAFINNSLGTGGDDLVTLIVVRTAIGDTGTNTIFGTKEYDPDGVGATYAAGDWAPELTLVPEPATMALLMLGLPFALRRRR